MVAAALVHGFPWFQSRIVPKVTPGMNQNLMTLSRSTELGRQKLGFLYSQRTSKVICTDMLSG